MLKFFIYPQPENSCWLDVYAHYPSAKIFSTTRCAPMARGYKGVWLSFAEHLGCLWASWRIYTLGILHCRVYKLILDGVCDVGSRIQVHFMSSNSPIFHFPQLFLSPGLAIHNLVLFSNSKPILFCSNGMLELPCWKTNYASTKAFLSMGNFLRPTVLQGSWTTTERGFIWFISYCRVHSQYQGLQS